MKKIALVVFIALASIFGGMTVSSSVNAADGSCSKTFLGLVSWFDGLVDGKCNIVSPDQAPGGLSGFIWKIALNVIQDVVILVAYAAGIYVLYGGFMFITSRGHPEGAARARSTMLNAIIGLIISISAAALVAWIGSNIK